MKIKSASDLHLDIWSSAKFLSNIANDKADILVLAGDILSLRPKDYQKSLKLMRQICDAFGDKPVFYVLGNHEFYGTWPNIAQDVAYDLENDVEQLYWLRRDRPVEYSGHRFLGDTMWFPKIESGLLDSSFSDFNCIRNLKPWVYQEHSKFKDYLNKELKEGDVVVTHHAPSNKSIAIEYVNDIYNRYFIVPDMEQVVLDKQPQLWIHGHVHNSFDYLIDKTRIVCNPLGYEFEGQDRSFDPNLIIEI